MIEPPKTANRVGILNFQYSTHNYGAVLQAAALEYMLKQLGYEPKHLDYEPKQKSTLKSRVGQLLRVLGILSDIQLPVIKNQEAFENFRIDFLSRTEKITNSIGFEKVASDFDYIIVGSDQVWRPTFAKDPVGFFLGYVPEGTKRVAYAASFGTSSWELPEKSQLTQKIKGELKKFKAISCREESGVDICKQVFDVKAVHVLDPLLFVADSFFEKIVSKSLAKKKGAIVYYKLDVTDDFIDDLKVIGKKYKREPVNIYLKASKELEYREVSDWFSLILSSEVVITDSFHCICLALRFGKEVIYCPNESRGQTRLDSLFKKLDIDVESLDMSLKTSMFSLIIRSDIEKILEEERVYSADFLTDALSIRINNS